MANATDLKYFEVFFEIYGKKLKTTVKAHSHAEAKEIVKSKIVFHKVEVTKSPLDRILNDIDDILKPDKWK